MEKCLLYRKPFLPNWYIESIKLQLIAQQYLWWNSLGVFWNIWEISKALLYWRIKWRGTGCEELKEFQGWWKKNAWSWGGNNTCWVLFECFQKDLHWKASFLPAWDHVQQLGGHLNSEWEKNKGTLGEWRIREAHISKWCHSAPKWEPLGQGASEGRRHWGLYNYTAYHSHSWHMLGAILWIMQSRESVDGLRSAYLCYI